MTEPHNEIVFPAKGAIAKMPLFFGLELAKIVLVTTPQMAKAACNEMLLQPFLGFDTESRPTFRKGEVSEGPHVLQFATMQRAYIFQTHHSFCAPAIKEILQAKKTVKIGFGLDDDIKRIGDKFTIEPQAIVDLDHTFRRSFGQKNSVGIKAAIAYLFNRRLLKSRKITTTNWSNQTLTDKQLLYAANDAYGAIAVYEELKKRGVKVVRHMRKRHNVKS